MQKLSETKVEDLKQQIITTLPEVLSSADQGCGLNKLLLDYFIHSEISKQASEQAVTIPVFQGAPKVSEGQLEATTDDKDSNQGAIDDGSCSGSLDEEDKPLSSKAMPITKCPHPNRKHYAKVGDQCLNNSDRTCAPAAIESMAGAITHRSALTLRDFYTQWGCARLATSQTTTR